MKLAATTADFSHYFSDRADQIRALHRAGFRYIDLNLYDLDKPDNRFLKPDWREYTASLAELAKSLGMTFVQAHTPGSSGNPLVKNEHYDHLIEGTIRSIEVCAMLGIPNAVIHTGWLEGVEKEQYYRDNLEFLRSFFPAMEKYGVNLLIENSTRANMGTKYFFYEGRDMKEFLEYANHPLLHACWDTGHANCEGHMYQDIIDLGEDLYGLHIHDNRSRRDEHMMPWMGTLNLDELICALLDSGYKGYFTFEAENSVIFPGYWLGRRREFPRDTRLAEPPLFLGEELERLLYRVGEYALKAYGCFEE